MLENKIETYGDLDEKTNVEVKFNKEIVWLSKIKLNVIFNRYRTVTDRHIQNIFKEKELEENVVCADFAHTTIQP